MAKEANSNNLGKSLPHVIKQADDVFSRVIRFLPSDNGLTKCFLCGLPFHWTTLDCMHYRKRRHLSTRFLKLNCYPGCRPCHTEHENDDTLFKAKIDALHGEGTADNLTASSHKERKFTVIELTEYILYWNEELKFKSRT